MVAVLDTLKRMLRRAIPVLAVIAASAHASGEPAQFFDAFLAALWPDAQAKGISRATFDAAFAGVEPDGRVIAAMQRQPEYGKPFGAYIDSMVSQSRIARGLRKSAQWAETLRAVDDKFQVEPSIIVAIWGIESSFGDAQEHWDVFRSLATLAQARFQHPLFRDQLLGALLILQSDHIPRSQFLGSWAGAMGQTQFLPSSFLTYAVDFDGDGRPDIWTSVPDVLASIANYLQKSGWQPGIPWGFEVIVPQGFDYAVSRGPFREWSSRGLVRADGGRFPAGGDAVLFFPSGAAGPAFLVTKNFDVLKTYNNSDAYTLAVGHLSDRLRGLRPLHTAWPVDDFQPSRDERIALQNRLAALGYTIHDFTGHFDFDLRDDVRDMQHKYSMLPDGYPSRAFLERIEERSP
jgi:peptidoglycan lytic transglycosylase B